MGVMLDTSVIVAAERGAFDMPAFLAAQGETSIAIAAVTAAELLYGVEKAGGGAARARRGAFVEGLLAVIPVVAFGVLEARQHAQIWAALSRKGKLIGPHDVMIAATALAHGFALATLNAREFSRVPGLTLQPLDV